MEYDSSIFLTSSETVGCVKPIYSAAAVNDPSVAARVKARTCVIVIV
jgi:hypothetical protein